MKISIVAMFDALFSGFIAFIISLVLLGYFLDITISAVISTILAIFITIFAFKKLNDKKSAILLKKEQEKQKNACINTLNLLTRSQVLDLFYSAVKQKNCSPERKNNAIIIKQHNVALFFCFSFDGVTKRDVVRAFNSMPKDYTAYIFSDCFSAEIIHFINRFNKKILTVDGVETYKFLKSVNALPQSTIDFSGQKLGVFSALKSLLQRKNAKRYFSFGVVFLVMSYFVPIKLYYVVVGCLFLIFALLCRLFGIANSKN